MGNTQNIISFCTGYGGIELGLELAGVGVRTVAACEIETYAVANLVQKMEAGALESFPIWTNLKTFDGRPFRGKVHGITGGYPCQPFSHAGKRQGTGDPRHLWPFIREHIRTIRPVWCFFENVAGHLSMGFDEVLKDLRDLQYKVEAGLFTAAEVGAPHKRQRLFILAHSLCQRNRAGLGEVQEADGEIPQRHNDAKSKQSGELADTHTGGSRQDREQCEFRTDSIRESSSNTRTARTTEDLQEQWPARPGQPQYEWEEPRTVERCLGREFNGTAEELDANRNRVDRLRALGNGVVPQTAAKAWITLWEQMK